MDALPIIQEVEVMGDKVKKSLRAGRRIAFLKPKEARGQIKKGSQQIETPFRKGATSAKRDAASFQEAQIKEQRKTELLRKIESDDEIARRKGLAQGKGSGRRSLIRSAPTGLAQTLGG